MDLSQANLINGNFSTADFNPYGSDITGSAIDAYLPKAKIGSGAYVYVESAYSMQVTNHPNYNGNNFFSLSTLSSIAWGSNYHVPVGTNGVNVAQAYNMDKKMDDGLPLSGTVTAVGGCSAGICFANGDSLLYNSNTPGGSGIAASSTTCFDNKNSASNTVQYSVSQNNGAGLNCSLSFKFQ